MARYTGPKARINRRLGSQIYESRGSLRALDRRNSPPGMRVRVRRPSNYGMALMEKQKIKHYYGLGERQLRRYFTKAGNMRGNTGEQLLMICEKRLDNVVRRAGFAFTRPQARQGIVHGHFQVNGIKVTKPSYLLRPGDVITVRSRTNLQHFYRANMEETNIEPVEWLATDAETLRATVQGLPGLVTLACLSTSTWLSSLCPANDRCFCRVSSRVSLRGMFSTSHSGGSTRFFFGTSPKCSMRGLCASIVARRVSEDISVHCLAHESGYQRWFAHGDLANKQKVLSSVFTR